MKLSEQVITLEQAEKLFELGIEQKSAFYHVHNGAGWQIMPDGYFTVDPEGGESYSAFTVAELGKVLKDLPRKCFSGNGWCFPDGQLGCEGKFKSEAEARGSMLIQQLVNGLVPSVVTERLND